jgi:hypothetical protein
MHQQFVCPACGHETAFDPARCPWRLVLRPDGRGGTGRHFYSRVRCAGCGREEWVPAGLGESGRREGVRGMV